MPFQPGHKLSGNRKGYPNRRTHDLKAAIGKFVGRNTPQLQRWLNRVAEGYREPDVKLPDSVGPNGEVIPGVVLPGKWIVKPDPGRAFELLQSLFEYQLPRLSRAEIVQEQSQANRVIDSSQLTVEQRQQLREMIEALAPQPALLEKQASTLADFTAPGELEPMGLAQAQVIDNEDNSE